LHTNVVHTFTNILYSVGTSPETVKRSFTRRVQKVKIRHV